MGSRCGTRTSLPAAVHCAPPDNKPAPDEFDRCISYLERELDVLKEVRVVVALGNIGGRRLSRRILRDRGVIRSRAAYPFGHGNEHTIGANQPILLCSYHPSQQNTSTGKLTKEMLRDIFARGEAILANPLAP